MRSLSFQQLTGESPLIVTVSISLLCTVSLLRFVILPHFSQLLTLQKERKHYESLISSETGIQQIKLDISTKIEQLKKRIASTDEQKKITSDVSGFLETLISVARKADIRFVRIQPQAETVTSEFTLSPVMLALTTTYHELGQFISALEKMPLMFTIDRLAMDASVNGKCDVKLLVTCLVPLENTND